MKILILILVAMSFGCVRQSTERVDVASFQSREERAAQLRKELSEIVLTDGVSKHEAEIIAKAYFNQHVGCGAFNSIQDGGNFWIVDGAFGYGATAINGFTIDKRSGAVTSPIGPSFSTPFQIFPRYESNG